MIISFCLFQSDSKVDIKTSVLMVDGSYHMVTLDYTVFPDDYVEGQETDDKSLRYFHIFSNNNFCVKKFFVKLFSF